MTVYIILTSWGGPCFVPYLVCKSKEKATAVVAEQQKATSVRRQWLVQPMELDES